MKNSVIVTLGMLYAISGQAAATADEQKWLQSTKQWIVDNLSGTNVTYNRGTGIEYISYILPSFHGCKFKYVTNYAYLTDGKLAEGLVYTTALTINLSKAESAEVVTDTFAKPIAKGVKITTNAGEVRMDSLTSAPGDKKLTYSYGVTIYFPTQDKAQKMATAIQNALTVCRKLAE